MSFYLYTSLISKYSCPYLVSLGAFDSLLSLLPHISLSSRSSPDQSLRSTWNLLVDIQCVDMGSKHVVPEAQTHASTWGGLVDSWWNYGPLAWTSRGGSLHVDIESCVKGNILVTVLYFFFTVNEKYFINMKLSLLWILKRVGLSHHVQWCGPYQVLCLWWENWCLFLTNQNHPSDLVYIHTIQTQMYSSRL